MSHFNPKRTSYGSFCSFNDPDGNTWLVQEVTTRLPEPNLKYGMKTTKKEKE